MADIVLVARSSWSCSMLPLPLLAHIDTRSPLLHCCAGDSNVKLLPHHRYHLVSSRLTASTVQTFRSSPGSSNMACALFEGGHGPCRSGYNTIHQPSKSTLGYPVNRPNDDVDRAFSRCLVWRCRRVSYHGTKQHSLRLEGLKRHLLGIKEGGKLVKVTSS